MQTIIEVDDSTSINQVTFWKKNDSESGDNLEFEEGDFVRIYA